MRKPGGANSISPSWVWKRALIRGGTTCTFGELLEEIEMPEGAAELAVGDGLEAQILLQLDGVADRLVLDARAAAAAVIAPRLRCVARVEQLLAGAAGCRHDRRGTAAWCGAP